MTTEEVEFDDGMDMSFALVCIVQGCLWPNSARMSSVTKPDVSSTTTHRTASVSNCSAEIRDSGRIRATTSSAVRTPNNNNNNRFDPAVGCLCHNPDNSTSSRQVGIIQVIIHFRLRFTRNSQFLFRSDLRAYRGYAVPTIWNSSSCFTA